MKYRVILVLKNKQGACTTTVDATSPQNALIKVSNMISCEAMAAWSAGGIGFIHAERILHGGSRVAAMVNVGHIAYLRIGEMHSSLSEAVKEHLIDNR
mgnify:CR=1 FL=1